MITDKDIITFNRTEDGIFEAEVYVYHGENNYTHKIIRSKDKLEFVKELNNWFSYRKFEDVYNGIIK